MDTWTRYAAKTTRLIYEDGREVEYPGPGGLTLKVEEFGLEPLGDALAHDPTLWAVILDDESVSLKVNRSDVGARLTVRWATGEVLEEDLELPPAPFGGGAAPSPVPESRFLTWADALRQDGPVHVFDLDGVPTPFGATQPGNGADTPLGSIPQAAPLGPAWLRERLGIRDAYIAGAMAGGIASAELVIAMGEAGLLGFFGAGGLGLTAVREAVIQIKTELGDAPAGFNLLHNPVEPSMEESTVDLYLEHGCRYVSASAFMGLSPAVVRYRYTGIREEDGQVVCPNVVFAKISRAEVAMHFLRPAPTSVLEELVRAGRLTEHEARLASRWPMADAVTCEADSGGHTDRRPLVVLLPMIRRLRDEIALEQGYADRGIRIAVGAAGGLGTPHAIHAAMAMGADYVLTGSINQATLEAGTSTIAKEMLLQAGMADFASGPAPDMFELGAHVQVLSRGSMYASRGNQLYAAYKGYASWEELPEPTRRKFEKQILGRPFAEIWDDTRSYWEGRDARQVERAEEDGRHKMALVFRWYLGMSSRWARTGETGRKRDFQIWCGPSMGAFNGWVIDTPLEPLSGRTVVGIADALIRSTRQLARAQALAGQGIELPGTATDPRP